MFFIIRDEEISKFMANASVAFVSSLLLQAMCASIGVRCPDFAQSCAVVSMVATVATSTTLAERSGGRERGEGEGGGRGQQTTEPVPFIN